jgi:hypothetical protein
VFFPSCAQQHIVIEQEVMRKKVSDHVDLEGKSYSYEEMFNLLSLEGNANQNITETPFDPSQNGTIKETRNASNDMGKRTLIHCWWKCKLVQPLSV